MSNPDPLTPADATGGRREDGLLGHLSQLVTRLQKARAADDVMTEVGEGLARHGIRTIFVQAISERLVTRYVAIDDDGHKMIRGAYQRALETIGGPMSQGMLLAQALSENRVIFVPDLPTTATQFFEEWGMPSKALTASVSGGGYGRAVICPLRVLERPWGALCLFSSALTEEDLPAIRLFGAQVSSALEISQAIESLQRTNRQLTAIHELAKAGTEIELGVLMPRMLDTAAQVTTSDYASIHLLDATSTRLQMAGSTGKQVPLAAFDTIALPASTRALLEHPPLARALSIEEWPLANREGLRAHGFSQLALLNLTIQGHMAGFLTLGRLDYLPFSAEDLHGGQLLADQIAVQLDRVRLYSAERRRAEDLSAINELGAAVTQHLDLDRLVQVAVAQAARVAHVPHAFVLLFEPDQKTLRVVASNLDEPDSVGQLLGTEQPSLARACIERGTPLVEYQIGEGNTRVALTLATRFGHQALVAVPLLARGGPVGAMVLGETRKGRTFSDSEINRARAVGHQLAVAIANARLYEGERQRVEELNLLLEVGRVITGSLDLQQILEASVGSLARMVQASDAFIWLYDPGTRILHGGATTSLAHREYFQSIQLPITDPSAAGQAILTRSPVRLDDTRTSGIIHPTLNERLGMKSLLAVPLVVRDVAIGAVMFGRSPPRRTWLDTEVERATVMCRQVAVAVANARLFEDLRRSYDTLARTQEEFVKRERLAALGELAAVVAHEVRNPLGVIFNSLVSLKKTLAADRGHPASPASQDTPVLLEMMSEEADRLNRIVADLLDFSRPHDPDVQPESLEQVISGAREATQSLANGVEIRLESLEPLPPVPMDARMLRQALVNLLTNSVQAMPKGGEVRVRTHLEQRSGRSWATVEVSDDGPGITQATAERIFQPFFTTKATGTGLGLAVVKRIVEAHRGYIGVVSVEGKGTTFTLRLPLET